MSYQVVKKVWGYRIGYYGNYQKRVYVRFDSGSIEFTNDATEASLFSQDEVIEVFRRLMGTAKRNYFIYEDKLNVFSDVAASGLEVKL